MGHWEKDCWMKDPSKAPKKGTSSGRSRKPNPKGKGDSTLDSSITNKEIDLYSKSHEICDHASMTDKAAKVVAMIASKLGKTNTWYMDSGASDWICNAFHRFENYVRFARPMDIILGDNSTIPAYGMGTIHINTSQCMLVVKKVLFIPKIGVNLASISRIMQDGSTTVTFHANHCD